MCVRKKETQERSETSDEDEDTNGQNDLRWRKHINLDTGCCQHKMLISLSLSHTQTYTYLWYCPSDTIMWPSHRPVPDPALLRTNCSSLMWHTMCVCVLLSTCLCLCWTERLLYSGWHHPCSGLLREWWRRWKWSSQTTKRKLVQGLFFLNAPQVPSKRAEGHRCEQRRQSGWKLLPSCSINQLDCVRITFTLNTDVPFLIYVPFKSHPQILSSQQEKDMLL